MKILKAIKCFIRKVWMYTKCVFQKMYHDLNEHNPDYVLSNYNKIPAYLKTRVEMGNCLSLDELEKLS